MNRLALLCSAWLFASTCHADVTLPKIFGDHMVLQRGVKAPIWGTADAGEKITVTTGQQQHTTTADASGRWRVMLDPIQSDQPVKITIAGNNTIEINDVLVGEVWLCSGQSNMEWPLSRSSTSQPAIAEADKPKIRLFIVEHAFHEQPQDDVKSGRWMVCTPETVKDFSAVGYHFGLELHEKLNVPVGLIESNWGGTRAEAWTPTDALDRLNLPYEPAWSETFRNPPRNPNSNRPATPRLYQLPGALFNAMIHPLAGYAMRGAIWYQGESNAGHWQQYDQVLAAMITSWRKAWGQGDFPFLVVQLANFDTNRSQAPDEGWPGVRAAQAKVARELPNVGLAVTIDIGESRDIHPRNKIDVGRRLARVARKIAYGESIEHAGPTFKSLQIDGERAIVSFDHAQGLKNKGEQVLGFEIAGEDGKFVPATAIFDGEQVVVTSTEVKSPKAVRYGWDDDPRCTLYNGADLPAVPFSSK